MYHQHRRQLSWGACRTGQIALYIPVSLWRVDRDVLRLDSRVGLGDLLGPCVIVPKAFPDRGSGHARRGEFLGAIEEAPAVDIAVDIKVEKVQQLLWVIRCFLSFHTLLHSWAQNSIVHTHVGW